MGNYLHLGCGGLYHEGFTNVDRTNISPRGREYKVDVIFDLGGPWPFESESFDGITSMHTLQQVDWRGLAFFAFPEAFRVLKKGGVMRFGCPMVEIEDKSLEWLLGWNNINLFHEDLLKRVLVDRIGFSDFKECEYRQSAIPELGRVDNRKDRGTRYYEVTK